MPRGGFASFAIPEPVADQIRARVGRDKAYRSVSEYVKAAVLAKIERDDARGAA